MAITAEAAAETVAEMIVEMIAVIRAPIRETAAAAVKSAGLPELYGRRKRPPETRERLSGMRERL